MCKKARRNQANNETLQGRRLGGSRARQYVRDGQ